MIDQQNFRPQSHSETAAGDQSGSARDTRKGLISYVCGLALALVLTAASFWALKTDVIYGPGVPLALITLAVAQVGVHLVFFLHVTTSPDNTNTVMALAFGVLYCLPVGVWFSLDYGSPQSQYDAHD